MLFMEHRKKFNQHLFHIQLFKNLFLLIQLEVKLQMLSKRGIQVNKMFLGKLRITA